MSALDILEKLQGIKAHDLDPLRRVLLVSDGTLTEILEAYFYEHIQLIKLSQQFINANSSHVLLASQDDATLLERKILLRGESSNRNYVYAESVIAVDRLAPPFRKALLHSNTPLGRLWLQHKLETFKEMTEARCQPASELGVHFGCEASSLLLMRTYRVFAGAQLIMVISEYFPEELMIAR